jgi:hypothetical protein
MALTFTFAGDEAGDASFKFEKGASRYFAVAVVATEEPEGLRSLLGDVRQKSHLPPGFDFHFNSLASAKLRNLLFSALKDANFEAWGIIVDKTTLPDTFRFMSGLDFHLYFIAELISQIPFAKRSEGTLILDEFGSAEQTRKELIHVMKTRHIQHGFRRISIRRSQSESLIQAADLVAGAILRRDTHKESEAFDKISRKVRKLIEYR